MAEFKVELFKMPFVFKTKSEQQLCYIIIEIDVSILNLKQTLFHLDF